LQTNTVKSITITTNPEQQLYVGDTLQIEFKITPATYDTSNLLWSTDTPDGEQPIVDIDNSGMLTANDEGTVVITLGYQDSNKSDSILLNIKDGSVWTGNKQTGTLSMYAGTHDNATILTFKRPFDEMPDMTFGIIALGKDDYEYKEDDLKVEQLTVDESGKVGVITIRWNGENLGCNITVNWTAVNQGFDG
jgi:hypothetical protein